MKLIIAGGRDFTDYKLLKDKLDAILANTPRSEITILDGCALGADRLGRQYSTDVLGKPTMKFPAKWDDITAPGAVVKYTKGGKPYNAIAGHQRNEEMAKASSHCILFWDGSSTGTKNMLDLAKKYKLQLRVIKYETIT